MLCKNFGCEDIKLELKETVCEDTEETIFVISGLCGTCGTRHEIKFNGREFDVMTPLVWFTDNPVIDIPWA
jgi:hypothetical protein